MSPHVALEGKALKDMCTGKLVNYSDLKVFNCSCFVYIQDTQQSEMDSNSRKRLFLGFKKGIVGCNIK